MKHESEFCQLISLINLYALRDSLKNSIEDIKTKHPERLDLIEPMETHLVNLRNAIFVMQEMERTIKNLRNTNAEYARLNITYRHKLSEYEEEKEATKRLPSEEAQEKL